MPPRIDIALSIDFDGVLARSPFAHGVLFPVLHELGEEYASREGLDREQTREQLWELLIQEFRQRQHGDSPVAAYRWEEIVAVVARRLSLRFHGGLDRLTREFAHSISARGDRSLLYPDAIPALQRLHAVEGICIILLTNGLRAYQAPLVEALGLSPYFHGIFASDDLDSAKPHPEAFERAFLHCREKPQQPRNPAGTASSPGQTRRLHVGDSLTQDVAGARGAGVTAIWLYRELPEALQGLSPRDRAASADLADVLREKRAAESRWTGSATAREADGGRLYQPDLVIGSLEELPAALQEWVEKADPT